MSTKTIERIGVPIFDSLPSLDLGTFISGADLQRKEFADALLNSFLNTGFVKLKNHGIPDTAIRDSFAWVRETSRKLMVDGHNTERCNLQL